MTIQSIINKPATGKTLFAKTLINGRKTLVLTDTPYQGEYSDLKNVSVYKTSVLKDDSLFNDYDLIIADEIFDYTNIKKYLNKDVIIISQSEKNIPPYIRNNINENLTIPRWY